MKLKFILDSKGKKVYTLKDQLDGKKAEPAHYKFIKVRDVKPSE